MKYREWTITYSDARPVTGRWRAERFGVGVSSKSEEGVKKLVDYRIEQYPKSSGA